MNKFVIIWFLWLVIGIYWCKWVFIWIGVVLIVGIVIVWLVMVLILNVLILLIFVIKGVEVWFIWVRMFLLMKWMISFLVVKMFCVVFLGVLFGCKMDNVVKGILVVVVLKKLKGVVLMIFVVVFCVVI